MFSIRMKWIITIFGTLGIGLAATGIAFYVQLPQDQPDSTTLYRHHSIDERYPFGHISAQDAGDIDLDGYPDIVIRSGKSGEAEIAWYRNPLGNKSGEWRKYRLAGDAYPSGRRSSGSALLIHDVNRDGRPDVITGAKVEGVGNGLFWWEAPKDPRAENWRRHLIAAPDPLAGEEFAPHDLRLADIDLDGSGDLVIGGASNQGVHWARIPSSPTEAASWELLRIGAPRGTSYAGLGVGDIDGDDRPDVAHADVWYRAAGPLLQPEWQAYAYGLINAPPSNVVLYDVDADGRLDIVTSSGHNGERGVVVWYKPSSDPTRLWKPNKISSRLLAGPESLLVLASSPEIGPLVITAELDYLRLREKPRTIMYTPTSREAESWQETLLFVGKNFRSLKAIDLDKDGDLDLCAISFAEPDGYAHVDWFENTSERLPGQHE